MTTQTPPEPKRPRIPRLGPARPMLFLAVAVLAATLLTAGALVASIP